MASVDLKAYQERLALLESSFETNRQRIAEKVKEPSKTVSLEDTDTLLLEIGAMIDEINKLVKANNDVVAEKRSSKNRCKIEIIQFFASLLAADVKSYRDEVARLNKELDAITARGQQLRKDLNDLNAEISELNKHNANTEAAIDSINKILRDSGFQGFSLRAKEGVENVYEVIREDGLRRREAERGRAELHRFPVLLPPGARQYDQRGTERKDRRDRRPRIQYGQHSPVPRQRYRPGNDQCVPEQYGVSKPEGARRLHQAAVHPDP